MNWQQRQEGSKLPPAPIPAGLSHWRQGEQVCQGSLLQQALLPLTNARVEGLPCNSSLPLGPTPNNGRCQRHSSSNARGCCSPSTGTPGAGAHGTAARSHAGASQQHPTTETSRLRSAGVQARAARLYPRQTHTSRRGVSLPVMALLPSGKGWLGKSTPRPGWYNLSPKMMPEVDHFAGSFIQAGFTGKGRQGARLMTRFQTGSAGTVPGLLNAPLLRRVTGHLPAATPTAGLRPPPLASAWHFWNRE